MRVDVIDLGKIEIGIAERVLHRALQTFAAWFRSHDIVTIRGLTPTQRLGINFRATFLRAIKIF